MKSGFSRNGFTLVELLIYTALTVILVGLFGGILITVVRIQGQQNGIRQTTQEADFIVSTIKNRIRSATGVTVSSTTLTLATAASSTNPTIISFASSSVYLQEGAGEAAALSTGRVIIDELTFSERASGSDTAVDIFMSVSYNTENPQQAVTQEIRTSEAPLQRPD